jgi:hypothetical protein
VVTATAQVIEKEDNFLTVHLTGVKHRNCAYLGLYAYGVDAAGGLHDIYREKIDSPEDRETRPKMAERQDFGRWRVWPVNWTAVVMYTRHDCNGRIVVTKLAGIPLDK